MKKELKRIVSVLAGVVMLWSFSNAVSAESCSSRGDLDLRYCDENGDLVADIPTDKSKWLNPRVLVFSYTPVEDPSVYENVFTEFMKHLSEKTGKRIRWYGAESYAAQVEAMRSGRLHVAGISTGPTVFGVNLAGYVPMAIMCKGDGTFGYRLQLITHKDSNIQQVKDLKGRKIAHVTPSSNSGNQAPRALFKNMGVTPDVDYEVTYSGKHDNSIMGVANRDYDAAPIASSVLDRMVTKGIVKKNDLRIVWESDPFPTTSYGFAHNLHPDLQKKIREAFLTFDWKGTALAKEFGKQADKFCAITFKHEWKPIRIIQKQNGTVYSQEALAGMRVKKSKKKKK